MAELNPASGPYPIARPQHVLRGLLEVATQDEGGQVSRVLFIEPVIKRHKEHFVWPRSSLGRGLRWWPRAEPPNGSAAPRADYALWPPPYGVNPRAPMCVGLGASEFRFHEKAPLVIRLRCYLCYGGVSNPCSIGEVTRQPAWFISGRETSGEFQRPT